MSTLDLQFIINSFVALFVIVDPVGNVPLFLSMIGGYSAEEQRYMIRRSIFFACLALVFFTLTGDYILAGLGIKMYSFRIAGGALLFIISIEMLFGRKTRTEYSGEEAEKRDIADVIITPLAIPLLTGPGALTTGLVFFNLAKDYLHKSILILNMLAVFALSYAILINSKRIFDKLGKSGTMLALRLMGLVLSSIAVQFIIYGIKEAKL